MRFERSVEMKNFILAFSLTISGAIGVFVPYTANAQVIEILCAQTEPCGSSIGVTADGTIFSADPNPTAPATGTGVFQPFVRIQDSSGTQLGYNTDTTNPDINFDTKAGIWTHSITLGDLGTSVIDGLTYFQFQLDTNESGKADSLENQIDITDIQIYLGGAELATPEAYGGYTGTVFDSSDNSLAGVLPAWTLDNAINGDVTTILQSSICDANGQCGSGHGDMNLFILTDMFANYSPDDQLAFYSEYDRVDSGFEEWRYLAATSVPEPGTLGLLLMAFGFLFVSRKRYSK